MYQIRTPHKARITNSATAAPITIVVLPPLNIELFRDDEDGGVEPEIAADFGGGGELVDGSVGEVIGGGGDPIRVEAFVGGGEDRLLKGDGDLDG